MKSFFITGTDTDVGKTLVARTLLREFSAQGIKCAGYKPVSAGCARTPDGLRNLDAVLLQARRKPAHEFAGMRPETSAALEDDADRAGPAGGKPLGADVRPVAEPFRRFQHARPRFGLHLRISAHRPADRRLRQADAGGKFLEVHPVFSVLGGPWCIYGSFGGAQQACIRTIRKVVESA